MAKPTQTNSTPAPNNDGETKPPKVLTAIEAITKIGKILDQLTETDRKRVLAFVNESSPPSA